MQTKKLIQGLIGIGVLALGAYQTADAASCLGPKVSWSTLSQCGGFPPKVTSKGEFSPQKMLCVTIQTSNAVYGDAYGYNSTGLALTDCFQAVDDIKHNRCDTSGCSTAVTHDAYAAW